jgi:DNA segregation ATPase FtsK/SpoIIIE, S-DNA-T family
VRATVTVVTPQFGQREDAAIEALAETPSGEVLAELARLVDADQRAPALLDGVPIEPMTPAAASGLRDGAILTLGHPGSHPGSQVGAGAFGRGIRHTGCLELRVVGGPDAGAIHPLPRGETTIGRGSSCDVTLNDADVSRHHAAITVTGEAVTVADVGSTNGSRLDGVEIGREPVVITPGMRVRIGESTLVVFAPDEPPLALVSMPDGSRAYNRPPRLDSPPQPVRVEFPSRPPEHIPTKLPIVATIAPLVAGVVLALIMRRPEYLLFTGLSPAMMVGQWVSERVGRRRADRARRAAYQAAARVAHAELAVALATEEAERRRRAPDLATLRKIAAAPSSRLWERRAADPDFLHLRLGCGALPATVEVANADGPAAYVHDVPVTISLPDVGVVGIAGPRARTAALARSLVCQLATLHSPRDLAVVLLTEPTRADAWEWIRWLPHVRPADLTGCQALLGLDQETVASRVGELGALVDQRHRPGLAEPHPSVVVIIDGARALRGTAGLAELLADGPTAGVQAICLDADESRLPEECGAVVTYTGAVAGTLQVRVAGASGVTEAVADGICIDRAERIARALAPLRDGTAATGTQGLPAAVRWLELAGTTATGGPPNLVDEIVQRWRRSCGGCTQVTLGMGANGVVAVDIARDGPHALVAGTTGSGKSELLQTLVTSLAVANRPDELTFVLVDYKGGAAFSSCATLPHTVGLVTDLDGSLVERALVSLRAELKRRESLLASAGATSIERYREAGHTLARLVIVVDEFASLADELPDFVGGLIGIAQRGRSLGVHLVLATQRPEGVVSADIRANTNLRICLAVMRDGESRDVIDTSDAARIGRGTPGRGYLRTGHGELQAFQCGWVGGPAAASGGARITVRRSPFRALTTPLPSRQAPAGGADATTDLDLIVDGCRRAAVALAIDSPPSPWLPPLPEVVASRPGDDRPLAAALGVRDVPARQAREPYVVDLARTGHLLVAGSARSGRSTTLRTLAALLARSTPTADLHMYAFDCAGGALAGLAALPQVGALVSGQEPERARRLISMLVDELTKRQEVLAAGGFGSIVEQQAASRHPLAHVVVLLDGWESFVASFDDVDAGTIVDGIFRLLREGAAVGVHVVASSGHAGLVGRLASSVDDRLVLRLADRGDFALAGIPARSVPAELPAGRGFLAGDLTQLQVCLLDDDATGSGQLAALARIARDATIRDAATDGGAGAPSKRPRRVDPLPAQIELRAIAEGCPGQPGSAQVVLGVGGDELAAVRIDLLEAGPGFVIAGPPRSGRSTALSTLAVGLRANGWPTIAITARPSPLGSFSDACFDARDAAFDDAIRAAATPLAILVDDAELVTDTAAAGTLDQLMRHARDAGHVVAIAGTTDDLSVGFRGFIVDARRARTGVLLAPRGPLDGEALGARLARDTGGRLPPGRGLLVCRGAVSAVQLALP